MKWGIRISNSHLHFSKGELITLFGNIKLNWLHELFAIVNCSQEKIDEVTLLSASIKFVIEDPITLVNSDTIIKSIEQINKDKISKKKQFESFAVKTYSVKLKNTRISTKLLEKTIGSIIYDITKKKIDLSNPTIEYSCIIFDEIIIIGWNYRKQDFKQINFRSPQNSPFFSGGAMKPMISKILVNLLYPQTSIILDPFCGHGGFLREIASQNFFGVGIEINFKIARECKINNKYHNLDSNCEIIVGDAVNQPFRKNAILKSVTDPPYAKQTTTKGRGTIKTVNNWLKGLRENNALVFTLPDTTMITIPSQLKTDFEAKDYVHNSLTRIVRRLKAVK